MTVTNTTSEQTRHTGPSEPREKRETIEDIINRVAATASAEDLALVERLTVKELPWTVEVIEITPPAAALVLRDHNSANRIIHLARSQMWARVMGRGEWQITKDTVAFNINGQICDGQHRCLGLLIHGSPVRFGVQFGEAVEARETYDAGTPRSAADILHMHGATDVSMRQAVIKSAIVYMQKLDKDVPAVPMDRAQTVEQAELHAQTLAIAIGLARRSLEKPEDMPASFESCLNLNTAGTVGFLMLSGGWGSGEVGSFLSALQLGIGEGENSPIESGAGILLKDRRSKARRGMTTNQKIALALHVAYLWSTNKRQALRAPKDLVSYKRPEGLPPDLIGGGIPLVETSTRNH